MLKENQECKDKKLKLLKKKKLLKLLNKYLYLLKNMLM